MGLAGADQVSSARPASQQPLGGGSAACKNLSIYYCMLPRSMCTSQLPLVLGVMRLNSGDCTPEAQSAQHREWLPACCSWLSGCEEGAVSLVQIGEERKLAHTKVLGHAPTRATPGPKTRLAQVPAAQAGQEAGQKLDGSCPVPAHPQLSHLCRTPGPPLITHTCPGPCGSQGYHQPANLPTGLRMRRPLARGWGQGTLL